MTKWQGWTAPVEGLGLTARGRAGVDTLLKDVGHHEQRPQPGPAFDCPGIRREPGLEQRDGA